MRNLGIRTRVAAWLLLVSLVAFGGGVTVNELTRSRLESSAEDLLQQLLELENSRLVSELDDERADVGGVADEPSLVQILDGDALSQLGANGALDLLLLSLIHI